MARISIRQLVGKLFQNFNISHIGQCNKTFIVNWQDDANASNRQANSLPAAPTCDPLYKYRSFDGTCNNLNNPRFGQAGTNFQRLMGPATYADGTESDFSLLWKHKRYSVIRPFVFTLTGVSAIRLSRSGAALPSTRLVSTTVTLNNSISSYDASLITMQWGQFMDHDLTQTPQFRISKKQLNGNVIIIGPE